jgi:hypothetical protein
VISPTDPAARYTASANSVAGYAYSDNYLIDLKHAVIVDVEATTAIRQAEVGAAKTMLDRTTEQFDLTPSRCGRTRKEHFSRLPYSATQLVPCGLLHGRLDKASSGGWLPN